MSYQQELDRRLKVLNEVADRYTENLIHLESKMFSTLKNGNKILTIGNGGSAANAQHITGDIVGRYKLERRGYPAITLTVDPTVTTAVSNDYGYENIFSRQVEALGKKGDMLIALSSSGYSENIFEAVKKAKEVGLYSVGIFGNNGGNISDVIDYSINFDYSETDIIEEITMSIFHIVLVGIEEKLERG